MFYKIIKFLVKLWRLTNNVRSFFHFCECRFYPSCSNYFLDAIKVHGPIFGTVLFVKRIVRCNPLCEGGIDFAPMNQQANEPMNRKESSTHLFTGSSAHGLISSKI